MRRVPLPVHVRATSQASSRLAPGLAPGWLGADLDPVEEDLQETTRQGLVHAAAVPGHLAQRALQEQQVSCGQPVSHPPCPGCTPQQVAARAAELCRELASLLQRRPDHNIPQAKVDAQQVQAALEEAHQRVPGIGHSQRMIGHGLCLLPGRAQGGKHQRPLVGNRR